jgi:hypothetical protein
VNLINILTLKKKKKGKKKEKENENESEEENLIWGFLLAVNVACVFPT